MTFKKPPSYDRFMNLLGDYFQNRITEKEFDKRLKEIPNADELAEMTVDLFRV